MKISKRIRKLVAAVMAALIINITALSPALQVQASEPAEATTAVYPLIQALLEILGISYGLGTSYEGMAGIDDSMVQDMIDKWTAGESLKMGDTEVPDLRDFDNAMAYYSELLGLYDAHVDGTCVNPHLSALDAKSYIATGTLYSKTMQLALQAAAEKLDENLFRRGFSVLDGGASSSGSSNDNEPVDFKVLSTLMTLLLAGQSVYGGSINEDWLNVEYSSIYKWEDLNMIIFNYNGYNFPIYYTSYFETKYKTDYVYKFFTTEPVYIMNTRYQGDMCALQLFSRNNFDYIVDFYYQGEFDHNMHSGSPDFFSDYNMYHRGISQGAYSDYPAFEWSSELPYTWVRIAGDFLNTYENKPLYLDKANGMSAGVIAGLSTLENKSLTQNDVIQLADQLALGAQVATGTETATDNIASVLGGYAEGLDDLQDAVGDTNKLLASLLSILTNIWDELLVLPNAVTQDVTAGLEGIKEDTQAIAEAVADLSPAGNGTGITDPSQPNNGHSNDFTIFINGLICLILILLKLLMIFFHCMEFIIAIFNIQAGTAFLPDEMIMGLDYIKSLQIPGIGMSVYGFMLGLVYIFILFYAIRTLRMNVNHMKMPGRR